MSESMVDESTLEKQFALGRLDYFVPFRDGFRYTFAGEFDTVDAALAQLDRTHCYLITDKATGESMTAGWKWINGGWTLQLGDWMVSKSSRIAS